MSEEEAQAVYSVEELACRVPTMSTLIVQKFGIGNGGTYTSRVQVDPLDVAYWLIDNKDVIKQLINKLELSAL